MAVPPDFVAGQILTAAQMNQIGSWLVKEQVVGTTVSAVTVTDAFTADYDSYRVVWTGGIASTSNNARLTFGAIATGYYAAWQDINYGSGATNVVRDNNAAYFSFAGIAQTTLVSCDFVVNGPNLLFPTTFYSMVPNPSTSGGSLIGSGYNTSALAHTSFTLTASTGTFTGGTIRVYGLRD
jgi:hypothetical protein